MYANMMVSSSLIKISKPHITTKSLILYKHDLLISDPCPLQPSHFNN